MHNRVLLSAAIAAAEPLRHTPAGVPAIALQLEHESSQIEAGALRTVKAAIKALAFGAMAERLAAQGPGSRWAFSGFLATPRNGKNAVLHIQDMQPDSTTDTQPD